MAKILNVDKLVTKAAKPRELVIDGETYLINEMTVENYVETTTVANRLIKEDAPGFEHVEATIAMIIRSVPTMPREKLTGRSIEVLNTIASFVRGDELEEAEDGPEEEAGK